MRSSFIITFLAGWIGSQPKISAQEHVRNTFAELAKLASEHLTVASIGPVQERDQRLSHLHSRNGPWGRFRDRAAQFDGHKVVDHIDGEALAHVVYTLAEMDNRPIAEDLLTKFVEKTKESGQLAPHLYHMQTIPFLQALVPLTKQERRLKLSDKIQTAMSDLIASYLNHYVGSEPSPPTDWIKSPLRCTCEICRPVSAFLQHPQDTELRVCAPEHHRKHLERSGYQDFDYRTEKTTKPYTMVISKNWGSEMEAHNDWADRVNTAGQKFDLVGKEYLRDLLMPAHKHLVDVEGIREHLSFRHSAIDPRRTTDYTTAAASEERRPLEERTPRLQGQSPASTVPAKRKMAISELVDHTSE